MTEQEQFIADLADSLNEITATPRQKEIYKATLRHAIAYAVQKSFRRKTGAMVVRPEPVAVLT
jgi:hypothetical protein